MLEIIKHYRCIILILPKAQENVLLLSLCHERETEFRVIK